MKLISKLQLLFLLIFLSAASNAQTNCQNAKPFCAGGVSGETFPATTNVTSAQTGPNYGCLFSTPNPAWYFLQISQSGNLDILIQGQISTPPPPSPGQDVDFICWGPFSSLQGVCDSLNANKIIDCSYSASFTETLNIPNGITGQYYMVLITNFANVTQDIIFTQYAGTGSTNCGLVGSNSKICAGNTATIVATNTGSLTNATYSISPGNLSNSTGTFFVSPLVTTNYTLFISGNNNLNQPTTQTAVANVTVNPQPGAAPTVTNTTCTNTVNAFNLNVSFTPTTATPGYTINWAPVPNGIGSTSQQTLTGGITPSTYEATITAAGGCSITTSLTIEPQPEPATIILDPPGSNHVLTCLNPVISLTAMIATNSYTWTNGLNAPIVGQFATFTNTMLGTWTINAVNPISNCISSQTLSITQSTDVPTNTVVPSFQNITCSLTSITTVSTSSSPSVNVTHYIYSPFGGTFTANSSTTTYVPAGPGIYTDCAVNEINGCSTCKQFTVMSNQGFPTFSVTSPQNYTLGCTTKSIATINIISASATNSNQVPTGGAVSYTLLPPGSNSATPSGSLSGVSSYTVNMPGTWTVVTKDNVTFCETRLPISVLQNTFQPDISVIVPRQILDCATPKIKLDGESITSNISYLWSFPGVPGNQPGDSITVNINTLSTTNTVIANFTLTITDNSSTCKSTSVVPMYQNIYTPVAIISNGGTQSLTCNTNTIMLTNQSNTGIPPSSIFPRSNAVIAYYWEGPSPQEPLQVSSTYVAQTPGVYTMTVKDLNNGCMTKTTTTIIDNKKYPILKVPAADQSIDCGEQSFNLYMDVTNANPSFVYKWTTPPNAVIGDDTKMPLVTSTPGTYKLLAKNMSNGCASSGEVTLNSGTLAAKFAMDFEQGFSPLTVHFTNNASSTHNNNGIVSTWNFGNGTYSLIPSATVQPVSIYNSPGIYTVVLYANKGECKATTSHTLLVDIPSKVIIPNVFTPNNDKVNDVFFLQADNLSEIQFTIFDRWGHLVFELTSTTGNIIWDGKNQAGVELSEGVYYYIMKGTGTDGATYDRNGTITLMR